VVRDVFGIEGGEHLPCCFEPSSLFDLRANRPRDERGQADPFLPGDALRDTKLVAVDHDADLLHRHAESRSTRWEEVPTALPKVSQKNPRTLLAGRQ
jgi:hypothetical protein